MGHEFEKDWVVLERSWSVRGVDPVNRVLMFKTLKEVEKYIKRNKNNKVPYVSIRNFI